MPLFDIFIYTNNIPETCKQHLVSLLSDCQQIVGDSSVLQTDRQVAWQLSLPHPTTHYI